jgi:protein-disulfide isomerase
VCAFHVLEVEPQLISEYVVTGRARLIYRHLAQIGEESRVAAEAMHCAGEQGAFWGLRAALYERQGDLLGAGSIEGGLQFIARELGLDAHLFASCLSDQRYRAGVQRDIDAAQAAGVRQRPTFEVNGTRLVGIQRYERIAALLDR